MDDVLFRREKLVYFTGWRWVCSVNLFLTKDGTDRITQFRFKRSAKLHECHYRWLKSTQTNFSSVDATAHWNSLIWKRHPLTFIMKVQKWSQSYTTWLGKLSTQQRQKNRTLTTVWGLLHVRVQVILCSGRVKGSLSTVVTRLKSQALILWANMEGFTW